MSFAKTEVLDSDRVFEGLRIPPSLNNVTSVSFVLTQEPGKLKPKDLKVAIEKNRAEKELRAEEQRKLREEGGGAGMLDLRGILSEERLNSIEGDPFKRQLREMAFLADIDDVEKLEIEKGFRISEDYIGSNLLSKKDIELINKQRKSAMLYKKQSQWHVIQSRNITKKYYPSHLTIKAGSLGHSVKEIININQYPHYDMNRNDLWSKRINTLRRFISLISRWLIRKRVKERMDAVMKYFHDNNCFTRHEIREFINKSSSAAASSSSNDKKKSMTRNESRQQQLNNKDDSNSSKPTSVSILAFSLDNNQVIQREYNKLIINQTHDKIHRGDDEINIDMVRRILFPRCNPPQGGGDTAEKLQESLIDKPIHFDDRALYQLKIKPDYLKFNYQSIPIPIVPIHLPSLEDKKLRLGAMEEEYQRAACDNNVNDIDVLQWSSSSSSTTDYGSYALNMMRKDNLPKARDTEDDYLILEPSEDDIKKIQSLNAPKSKSNSNNNKNSESESNANTNNDTMMQMPLWLSHTDDVWKTYELNFFDPTPLLRIHGAASIGPRRHEMDVDWLLRPDSEKLEYKVDNSIRTKWCNLPGFTASNIYLLGGQESLNRDVPPSSPGPTLIDYFLPDNDRHLSGLSCYAKDHLRNAIEWDHDITKLQHRQNKYDILTDSESDNEDAAYGDYKPSMERVRMLLKPPPPKVKVEASITSDTKGKKSSSSTKGKESSSVKPSTTTVSATVDNNNILDNNNLDTFSTALLHEDERKEEQVELLSDRKILEMESTILKTRRKKVEDFTDRLIAMSKQTKCSVKALSVQLPFHLYEDNVYKIVEKHMPPLKTHHVELNPMKSTESLFGANISQMISPSTRF